MHPDRDVDTPDGGPAEALNVNAKRLRVARENKLLEE